VKTIGLLGGMSRESTVTYYQELNRGVRERLGGLHSAPRLIASVDFAANCPLPVFDTTLLHVEAAPDWAFGSERTAGPD